MRDAVCFLVIKIPSIICFARGALAEESLSVYGQQYAQSPRLFSGELEVSHNYKPDRAKIPADLRVSSRAHASINNRDTRIFGDKHFSVSLAAPQAATVLRGCNLYIGCPMFSRLHFVYEIFNKFLN